MRNGRWAAVVGALMAAGLLATATAWACIAGPTLVVTPAVAKPGQSVAVSGLSYSGSLPIVVHLNAIDGPVLATFQPSEGRFGDNEALAGNVTIPATTKPGSYVLVATQSNPDGGLAQVPVRALLTVSPDGSVPVVGAPVNQPELGRPVGPAVTRASVSTGALVLVGLGSAGVAMFLAGIAILVSGRGRAEPEVARVGR